MRHLCYTVRAKDNQNDRKFAYMPNRLISDEKVNCSRQSELDLLKALPIVFMVIIHVYEIPNIPLSWVVPVGVLITLTTGILLQLYLKLKQETFLSSQQ